MGFSLWGLVVGLAVLAPNLLLLRFSPTVPIPTTRAPHPLIWLERAGQASCLAVPPITAPGFLIWGWTIPALVALAGYYALWGRYLLGGRDGTLLYQRWWWVPIPMAVFPVVVFFCAAAWLSNPWIAVAAAVLAAGHLPVSAMAAPSGRTRR
ncbi:hypothetical protein HOW07_04050 [Plantibacter sp. MCCC 1A11337]|uniref:hypothetical protein n=1 Tax=Plantibacter sp. MCCC 1A11337 TaxID=2736644 RepID=UPI001582A408|nr:hypothetical protein [Plantibacter sp. MCCC 1A11337]NUJ87178.1 hypothetical protein [Plantibacter sp. MCCC 1A11337]